MSKQEQQLDPHTELGPGEEIDQLSPPASLEELEAPTSDMFLENGETTNTKEDITEIVQEIKDSPEKQEQQEIKNVAEFLEVLEDRIVQCKEDEDSEEEMKLAFHLIKIKGALRQAKLRPEKLNLMSSNNNKMVDYNKSKNKLKVREDILEDLERDQKFLATIFSEIQFEKKENNKDTGFQLLALKKKMPINMEINKKERQATERIFDELGMNTALKLYDFKHPEKLADYFLEKEVEKRLKERKKINKAKSILVAIYLSSLFKKGAPELYDRLGDKNYAWRSKVWELIQKNQ